MWKKKLLCCCALLFAIPALANLEDFKVATWNLQGSSAANENKWNVSVRQLITGPGAADILAVQEAGVLPSTAMSLIVLYSQPLLAFPFTNTPGI